MNNNLARQYGIVILFCLLCCALMLWWSHQISELVNQMEGVR